MISGFLSTHAVDELSSWKVDAHTNPHFHSEPHSSENVSVCGAGNPAGKSTILCGPLCPLWLKLLVFDTH